MKKHPLLKQRMQPATMPVGSGSGHTLCHSRAVRCYQHRAAHFFVRSHSGESTARQAAAVEHQTPVEISGPGWPSVATSSGSHPPSGQPLPTA